MEAFDFHCTLQFGDDSACQKKKCFRNISKTDLRDAIMRKFNIDQSNRFKLQSYIPIVDDWEDIDDNSEIPDGGKIKLIIYSNEDTSKEGKPCSSNLLTIDQCKMLLRSMNPSAEILSKLSQLSFGRDPIFTVVNGTTRKQRNRQLIDFLVSLPAQQQQLACDTLERALREDGQEHVANLFHKQSDKMIMSEEHYQLLIHKRGDLSKFIDPDSGLLDHLASVDAITDSEFDKIRENDSKESRARDVVSVIAAKCDDCFDMFVNALNVTGQPHVVYILTGEGVLPMSTKRTALLTTNLGKVRKFLDPTNGLLDQLAGDFSCNERSSIEAKLTKDEQSTETISILMRKPDSTFDRFLDALRATGQSHVVHILTGEGDPPLSDEKVALIGSLQAYLAGEIDSKWSPLIDTLVSRQVLTDFDRQRVMAETINQERNDVLLGLIVRKSQKAYDNFLLCLTESKQKHVALILDGHKINGQVLTDVDQSKLRNVQIGLIHDIKNRKTELNENGLLKHTGVEVMNVAEGSILIIFKCHDLVSIVKLRELLNSGELDSLFTEMFCPSYAAEGLKSLRIVVTDTEFERCEETCKRLRVMTKEHRRILDDASKPLVGKIAITTELLDKLSLCKRRRQAIEAAETQAEQVRTLLSIVSYQPDSYFACLVDALKETGQKAAARFLDPVRDSSAIGDTVDLKDSCIGPSTQLDSYRLLPNSGPVTPRNVFEHNELHRALESCSFERAVDLINSSSTEYLAECYFVGDCEAATAVDSKPVSASFRSCLQIIAAMEDKPMALELCTLLLDRLGTDVCGYLNASCRTTFKDLCYYSKTTTRPLDEESLNACAIHIGAYNGNVDLVELLATAGADSDPIANSDAVSMRWRNTKSRLRHRLSLNLKLRLSALHLAAMGGHVDTIKILLQHGANINARTSVESSDCHTPLFIAAIESNTDEVALLLSNDADVNLTGDDGLSPLHAAALNGNVAIAEMLVGRGANVNATGNNGITPLCAAVKCGHTEVVRCLLKHHADIHLSGSAGCTVFNGIFRRLNAVTKGTLMKFLKCRNVTPLCAVTECGNSAIVDVFSDCYPDVKRRVLPSFHIDFPKHESAIRADNVSGVRKRQHLHDILEPCGGQLTPLHEAVSKSDQHRAKILIDQGARVNATNVKGNTPLHYAVALGNPEMMRLLLRCKADVNAKNANGETPLHIAAADTWTPFRVAKLLLDARADMNALNNRGRTPLFDALRSENWDVAKLLLESDADVKVTDGEGNTPLHLASEACNTQMVRLILGNHADVNAVRADGCTALNIALMQRCAEVQRLLVSQGADVKVGIAIVSLMLPKGSTCEHNHPEIPGQSMLKTRRQLGVYGLRGPHSSQTALVLPVPDMQVSCEVGSRRERSPSDDGDVGDTQKATATSAYDSTTPGTNREEHGIFDI